jgi:hypothetical protein
MAFVPLLRMGPPPRSLAADAHACIMVRVTATHRKGSAREPLKISRINQSESVSSIVISNFANTSRKHLAAAVPVSMGCSVASMQL